MEDKGFARFPTPLGHAPVPFDHPVPGNPFAELGPRTIFKILEIGIHDGARQPLPDALKRLLSSAGRLTAASASGQQPEPRRGIQKGPELIGLTGIERLTIGAVHIALGPGRR